MRKPRQDLWLRKPPPPAVFGCEWPLRQSSQAERWVQNPIPVKYRINSPYQAVTQRC
ncbi:hypothetical protein SynMINOS11_02535 [Synechococcus sp. Minos11]|nr:hypothetical protein SynMINOS11_02535 [Synechococcus sp. Minos11]